MAYRDAGTRFLRVIAPLTFLLTGLLASSVAAEAPKPITILALGDSLTAGYGLPSTDGFTAKLEAALKAKGVNAVVINAGLSGDTAAGGFARLEWALQAKPNFAIVELGANDGMRGLDTKETRNHLDSILTKLKAQGIPTLLAGMYAPPNMGPDYTKAFAAIYPELAAKHGALLYPFFLDGVAAQPELNLPDGFHPNAKGIDVIVERIMPFVLKLIGR